MEDYEKGKQEGLATGYEQGQEEEYKKWIKYAGMAGIVLEQPHQLKRIIPLMKRHEQQEGIKLVVDFIGEEPFEHNYDGQEHRTNDCFACRWQAFKERLEK